ncbi:2-oxoglutarate dehydrogenase complex dihydrolipoyllysine-residue succinyltransferase [Devosia sp. MC521]|uniref:2-oxoglutarate dehydrogenase complex dihydrolipoyllysine-residue succinyltransferase n=1 Tax=Devosia sp. MC521 TaxID=2759954 RepID=UPI0015FBDA0A|nr:2-oxoglutarate dehydrogenase complex dihydrolipoyllysine-residue succinyltransferase [Devosia sp. MC521]MBJ6987605.1 2-oxoglutarate dehydrogenase complex dihydrolipoyllysine-residue succinyltransferase [Devosia sp. MC521]QMW61956.1 2-oxoglutarate dehydrogenase complex dihydrolipoyllysine-residue succinyltransferase [Devosia sp. MC521]
MSTEIRVPTLGESVSEATIGQWYKKVGDTVTADEPLVELETDKVTIEVPAPASGVLEAIVAESGATVDVGALLGAIGVGSGAAVSAPAAAAAPTPAKSEVPAANAAGPEPVKPAEAATDRAPTPSAQKMINEKGLDAGSIAGSGKAGQVLKEDVLASLARPAAVAAASAAAPAPAAAPRAPSNPDDAAGEERVKMTRLRQTIARRLKDAQNTAAMLTTFNEVDMQPVMDMRARYKDLFEKKHGVKLGFMGFFTKAVVQALKEIPAVNAEIDGDELIYKKYAHIGVAVGTDKGLVVPVVRNADQMSIAEIEKEIGNLGKKARDGQLSMADMQGGTFTISNGGVYGSLMSTPILNAPQSGILGMHKIQERPVVVGGQIVIRPMMYLALSYDHRIVDGKEAVTFLVRVKESLESPERLVLDL